MKSGNHVGFRDESGDIVAMLLECHIEDGISQFQKFANKAESRTRHNPTSPKNNGKE